MELVKSCAVSKEIGRVGGSMYLTKQPDAAIAEDACKAAETEEWPDGDCPVTPEMVSAGVSALEFGRGSYGDQLLVSSVYRAMWEVRPLAPAQEDHTSRQYPESDE